MKKRILPLLLVLALCLSLVPGAFASGTEAEVPETPDKTVYTAEDLDVEAILAHLNDDVPMEPMTITSLDAPADLAAVTGIAAPNSNNETVMLPWINNIGQYGVNETRMNLDFDYHLPGGNRRDIVAYTFVYKGEVKDDVLVSRCSSGTSSAVMEYGHADASWNPWRDTPGTYTVVSFISLANTSANVLDNAIIAYHVYLSAKEIPLKEVYLADWETGERVDTVYAVAREKVLTTIAPVFVPANTTVNKSYDYHYLTGGTPKLNTLGGFLYFETDTYYNWSTTCRTAYGEMPLHFEVCKDAKGHTFGDPVVRTEPTCIRYGYGTQSCTKCGLNEDVSIPALGHDWVPGEILVPEEGDEWGIRQEVCSRCEKTQEVPYHTCPADAFKDRVPESSWAHRPIDYVLRHGLMNGMSATKFEPNGTLTRGQLVTILYRLAGAEAGETEVPFTDLTQDWYKDAVAWAFDNGIVNGMTETTFAPNVKVTRAMFATIMFRYYSQYLGLEAEERADLSAFPDAGKVASWAAEPMAWANAKGLINGVSRGGKVYLDPTASATRAQAAAILMRFCQMME